MKTVSARTWRMTGVVATASNAASAAVSPSLVAATAAGSCSFIASGASGGASPAAVELAQQGVHAMWYASIAKSAAVAAGVLVAAGALWAAQQGDGVANVAAGRGATAGVDLQAVAVEVADAEEPAVVTIAAAEPAKNGAEANEAEEAVEEALPQIRQLELERDHWLLKAKAYRMKAERWTALSFNNRGNEEEALLMEAESKLAEAKALEIGARLEALEKQPAAAQTWPMKLREAEALEVEVRREAKEGPMQLVLAAEAKGLELAREMAEKQADSGTARDQQEQRLAQQRNENDREIERLEMILAEMNALGLSMQLEHEQSERALLQRELERLHEVHVQINSPLATVAGAGESNLQVQGEALEQLKNKVQEGISKTKAQLQDQMERTSQVAAALEQVKRQQLSIERQLEHLNNRKMQLAFPQDSSATDPIQVRQLQATIRHLENELASRDAQLELAAQNVARATIDRYGTEDSPADSIVKPGDTIQIMARGVSPDAPIADYYPVEEMGTVALGPTYGRVKVAGLTILQVEEAIKKHLAEKWEDPMVQVTLGRKAKPSAMPLTYSTPIAPPSSAEVVPVPTVVTVVEQFEETVNQIERVQKALETENAELKKQLEELRKERPSDDSSRR